jgi:hypothetical protein
MQVTPDPHGPDLFVTRPNIVWDWRTNVGVGTTIFHDKSGIAYRYPSNMRRSRSYHRYIERTIDPARQAMGLPPFLTNPAPDFTTAGLIGSNPPNQLLEDSVRGYNGFNGPSVFGIRVLHEFIPNMDYLLTAAGKDIRAVSESPHVWKRVCSGSDDKPSAPLFGPVASTNCAARRGSKGDSFYVNHVAFWDAQCNNQ